MRNLVFLLLLSITVSLSTYAEDHKPFVGSWELLRMEIKDDSGQWLDLAPKGTKFSGNLMYSKSGMMQAQLFLSDRQHEILKAYPNEFINGYLAYFGEYSVDAGAKVVTHKRSGHIKGESANDVHRAYVFEDDILTLSPLVIGNLRIVWQHINP